MHVAGAGASDAGRVRVHLSNHRHVATSPLQCTLFTLAFITGGIKAALEFMLGPIEPVSGAEVLDKNADDLLAAAKCKVSIPYHSKISVRVTIHACRLKISVQCFN